MTKKKDHEPQDDRKDPVRLVEQVIEQPRLVDEYEESPGEAVGACLVEWISVSNRIATIKARINVKRLLANGTRKKEAKQLLNEANNLETGELGPLLDELETHTWRLVELLKTHEALRKNIENWLRFPKNLRYMLKRGFHEQKVNVADLVERADALEAEREKRLMA